MNIELGELKTDGKIMKLHNEFVLVILFIVSLVSVYVINFVQMIVAISNDNWNLAIIKAIGVFTFLGSSITVWF